MSITKKLLLLSGLLALFIVSACTSSKPFYASPDLEENLSQETYQNADTLHTFILIGDTGDPKLNQSDPLISTMRHHLEESPDRSSAVFLGDNIYSSGMPANRSAQRAKAYRG